MSIDDSMTSGTVRRLCAMVSSEALQLPLAYGLLVVYVNK